MPADGLPADLFREAWHCHDESRFPCAGDLFDAALVRQTGEIPSNGRSKSPDTRS